MVVGFGGWWVVVGNGWRWVAVGGGGWWGVGGRVVGGGWRVGVGGGGGGGFKRGVHNSNTETVLPQGVPKEELQAQRRKGNPELDAEGKY